MEFLAVSNVDFPVGIEFTRYVLAMLFSPFNNLIDVVIDERHSSACVSFSNSTSAQDALVYMNNTMLFGRRITVRICAPPSSDIPGYVLTRRRTKKLLVRGESFLCVSVKLRHVAGIVSATPIDRDTCVVDCDSDETAAAARCILVAHNNRRQGRVAALYLLAIQLPAD